MKMRQPKALYKASRTEKKRHEQEQIKEIKAALRRPLITAGPFDWASRARQVEEADRMTHVAASLRSRYAEANDLWPETVQRWRAALNVAYPDGFWENFRALRAGQPVDLEPFIEFLEADPWFFRTGYVKADIIRVITRMAFTEKQVSRLQDVVLHAVDSRDRREFRSYCRLARRVDSSGLRDALAERLIANSEDVRRRVRWVLDALGAFEKGPDDLRNKAWRFLTDRGESRGNHES